MILAMGELILQYNIYINKSEKVIGGLRGWAVVSILYLVTEEVFHFSSLPLVLDLRRAGVLAFLHQRHNLDDEPKSSGYRPDTFHLLAEKFQLVLGRQLEAFQVVGRRRSVLPEE